MMARLFIGIGLLFLLVGLALRFAPWLLTWFGRLPGDIDIDRGGTRIFFPITSMIVVSILLSLVFSLFFKR